MIKEIKWFIQRGRRGWADCDAWAADDHLSNVIIGMVKNLKKYQTGCPSELWDKEAKNNECHKWEEILEEIIQGFESAKKIKEPTFLKWYKKFSLSSPCLFKIGEKGQPQYVIFQFE